MADKIALVTGAGSGIGRAVAVALSQEGYRLALAGRRRETLEETASLLAGANHLVHPTDVGDAAAVAALFEAITRRFGRLDLLFNNAGAFMPPTQIEDVTEQDWHMMLAANLTGAFLCTQGAVRLMKRQDPRGGRIINNGSISATTPRPLSAAYTTVKHAMTGLTRATALDGRAFDIACGQIDIGNAATGMTAPMAEGALQADGTRKPEARMDVADAARAVIYMASLPLSANVLSMTVMATHMPFVGRG